MSERKREKNRINMVIAFPKPGLRDDNECLLHHICREFGASFLWIGLPEFLANFFSIAILAPLVEEFAKVYPLFYRHGETEKSMLGLGFLVGAGFGIVEFLLHIFVYGAPVLVRLPALLFHATNTSIAAYGIATRQALWFFAIAVFLHFVNNFSAQLGLLWFIGGVSATAVSYILSWRLYRRASERIINQ